MAATLDTANNLTSLDEAKHHLGIDPGTAQVLQVICTNEDAGGGIGAEYWLMSTPVNDYYVWYDVDDDSEDPAVSNRVGIEVDVDNHDSATAVATATAAALTAVTGITATSSTNTVTVTNDGIGKVTDPSVGTTPFTIDIEAAGSSGDETENDGITDLINHASLWFNNACDRQLKSRSQTEYHDYPGSNYLLYLNHPPISAVTLYTNADTPRAYGSDDEVDSDNYEVYTEDNLGKIYLTGATFIPGRRTIKATYTGGFSTIPADLKHACNQLIAHWYWMDKNNAFAVTGHNRPEGTGLTVDKELPGLVQQTVAKYKRYGFIV